MTISIRAIPASTIANDSSTERWPSTAVSRPNWNLPHIGTLVAHLRAEWLHFEPRGILSLLPAQASSSRRKAMARSPASTDSARVRQIYEQRPYPASDEARLKNPHALPTEWIKAVTGLTAPSSPTSESRPKP